MSRSRGGGHSDPGAARLPGGLRLCSVDASDRKQYRRWAEGPENPGRVPAGTVRQTMASRSTSSSTLRPVSSGGSRPARVRVASPCRAAQNTSVNSAG